MLDCWAAKLMDVNYLENSFSKFLSARHSSKLTEETPTTNYVASIVLVRNIEPNYTPTKLTWDRID